MEDIEMQKVKREKSRIDQLLSLADDNNGIVKTEDIADLWGIPPTRVKKYIEYLLRRYQVPIIRIKNNYPTYIFESSNPTIFVKETVESKPVKAENETWMVDNEISKTNNTEDDILISCNSCGKSIKAAKFCGYCGSDLQPAK